MKHSTTMQFRKNNKLKLSFSKDWLHKTWGTMLMCKLLKKTTQRGRKCSTTIQSLS